MDILGLCLIAAAVGSIPFALVLGKLRGVDIRTVGSGNVGATNVARACGLPWGVAAFFLDAAKGAGPVGAALALFPEQARWLPALAGGLAVLGHCFSPYLSFRGGKGVATAAGVLMVLQPLLFVGLLVLWAASLGLLRNVGVASSIAALAAGGFGVYFAVQRELGLAVFLLALSAVVLLRHRGNIRDFLRPGVAEVRG